MSQYDEVKQAKTFHREALLGKPNVIGVGVGYRVDRGRTTDELSVVVMVRQKLPPAALDERSMVPQEVAGVRTDVVQVGDVRALDFLSRSLYARGVHANGLRANSLSVSGAHTERSRPAPGGISLGHYKITAGTLGGVVYDRKTGDRLILSNNHVLANCNNAYPGDPILQPGPADGGDLEDDLIARLERFHPIRYTSEPATCDLAQAYASLGNRLAALLGSSHHLQVVRRLTNAANLVDAAVARPLDDSLITDESLEIGKVNGALPAALGVEVCKSGRTTALTTGVISVLDATITIGYGADRAATFEDQIVTTPMSQGGDSGSFLVTQDAHQAVGLLFAGSSQATIHNPIQTVCEYLDIDIAASTVGKRLDMARAQAVKGAYQAMLMSKANVVGVGVGLRHRGGKRTGEVGLVVMVQRKVPRSLLAPEDILPSEIEGVPVDVKEVGELKAY
jgi:hypothetical protein